MHRIISAILPLAVTLLGLRSYAATYVVSTKNDSGSGSLRQAILEANGNAGDDTIQIDVAGTIVLSTSLPQITGNTTLAGQGADLLTLSGDHRLQVLTTAPGTTNVLSGLTIANGWVSNNIHGAGISNAGVLTLVDCAIVNNHTVAGLGGGIYNAGDLTILNSTIASNSVRGGDGFGGPPFSGDPSAGYGGGGGGLGGGLFSMFGTVIISNSTVVGNRAIGGNGGMPSSSGSFLFGAHGGGPNGGAGGIQGANGTPGGLGGGGGGGGVPRSGGDGGFGGGGGGGGGSWSLGIYGGGAAGGFGGGYGSFYAVANTSGLSGGGGGGGGLGGGLFIGGGNAILRRVLLSANEAVGGADQSGSGSVGQSGSGLGGGLFGRAAALDIRECSIMSNLASGGVPLFSGYYGSGGGQGGGGGLYLLEMFANLAESTIASNRAEGGLSQASSRSSGPDGGAGNGGGLVLDKSTAMIADCRLSDNEVTGGRSGNYPLFTPSSGGAALGGGILVEAGDAAVIRCTVVSNNVVGGPGGVRASPSPPPLYGPTGEAHGGGVANRLGTCSLVSTIIAGNTASTNSAPSGVANQSGTLSLLDSLIGLNTASTNFVPSGSLVLSHADGGTITLDPPPDLSSSNSVLTLGATPSTGWSFLYWLGSITGTNRTVNISMTLSTCIRGVFGTSIGTTVLGNGLVNVSPPLALHPYGSEVRLTAVPAAGSYFDYWSYGVAGVPRDNPLSFKITYANPTPRAQFQTLPAGQFALTAISDGAGEVRLSPQTNLFNVGQEVTLTAVPEAGQSFVGWSGDVAGTGNPLVLTMDTNKMITAEFTKRPQLTMPECFGIVEEGGFRILLEGWIGSQYSIERSSDLKQWTAVANVTNTVGVNQVDFPSANATQEFYRAVPAGQ